jgi:flagellin-specific chaperone FliS
LKDEFYGVYNEYKDRRKAVIEAKNAVEAENLKHKKTLITRLKEVIEKEENIGLAYNAYKEIHEAWKNVGDIAREKRDEIQHEYSRLLEDFFYNMKIYRELKDHDLKRNSQLKLEVIAQLNAIKNNESIREIEAALKTLQNEWEGIGPVANDDWEDLKAKYWENVRVIYDRINTFYDERRVSLNENLKKKKELLAEVAALLADYATYESTKMWEEATVKLLALQETWKTVGFGPRKENEEIWQKFRKLCDEFFSNKKAFFGTIQDKFVKIAEEKQKVIDQAKALKDSTDWKETADKLVQLQKAWKNTGHAGQKLEQKLWTEFRGACDAFFNARTKHFEAQDKLLETNLLAKQTIIQNIESYKPSADKKQTLTDLREFTNAFNEAGKVPMKQKDAIYNSYKTAIDKLYTDLKLEGAEKEKVMFEARMNTLSSSPDAGRLFSKEKADMRLQIDKLKAEVLQFENNLGFFSKSKGADALRAEVEGKINASKNKIEALIRKMKMIPNE